MIQGDFYPAKRAKPVGFSGGQFRLVVEPLHHAAGKLFFGAEPVQQQAATTFFIGSICDRMTRSHHRSRNRPAQYGET